MPLDLGKNELKRLGSRVEEDYTSDIAAHDSRMNRFKRYYQRWRNRVDAPRRGEEDEPNFSVPLVQWNVAHKWADDIGKLIGADAEIVAKPTGPSDQRIVRKLGCYETWRIFSAMRLVNPFAVFAFRKTLFGRAHAYRPWVKDTYAIRDEGGNIVERVAYEGPGFFPLWPDELILPDERNVETIHDFSHVIRRYRVRPEDLLRGEAQGRYFGIKDNFKEFVDAAKQGSQRETTGEEIQTEKDEIEGSNSAGMLGSSESLTVLEWYGGWRRLKRKKDAKEDNLDERNLYENELVVRVIPEMAYRVIGAEDLMDLYPTMRHRRPFSEASLIKDGSYWCMGFGEMLESIEDETTVNHRLFTKAGQFSVGPVVFYKQGSGFDPETFRMSPDTAIPSEDPAGINIVRMQADLQYSVAQAQSLGAFAEKVTGVSDFSMGRQSDQPNAPRTARGTLALLEQGNIRANLDTTVLREDMGVIVADLFELEQQFPISEKTFFRVTEQQAGGLFPVRDGGSYIEPDELRGRYDFDLKFVTSVYSREAEKERTLAMYQLDLANPLVVQNPRALWMVTNRVHQALGDDNFGDIIPEPPDLLLPRTARQEWVLALEGEPFEVHPDDNDILHVREHADQVRREQESSRKDAQAVEMMLKHMKEHQAQHSQKLLRQALTNQLVSTLATNMASGQGLQMGGQPMDLQRLQQTLAQLTGGGAPAAPAGPAAPGGPAGPPAPGQPPVQPGETQ